MTKYYAYKVAGYFLYFTSKCIVEAFHVRRATIALRKKALPSSLSAIEGKQR